MASKKQKSSVSSKPFFNIKWVFAAILVVTVWSYSSGIKGQMLEFDDVQYFRDFPEITNLSWASLRLYFTKHYVLMYHPLPILSFAINHYFSELNPVPYHIVNLLFHLLNVMLVFKLLKHFIKHSWLALGLAAAWALHPMNTEAVTWISARSSVMYTFFFLGSMWFYLKFQERRELKFLLLSFLAALLSHLSKVNAVALPVVLVALEWFYSGKQLKKYAYTIPFFAIAVFFGLYALSDSGTTDNILTTVNRFETWEFGLMSAYSLWFYLSRLFVPSGLSAIHTYPDNADGMPAEIWLGFLALALLIVLVWKFRQNKLFLLGIGIFLIVVGPTLQLFPTRLFLMADRYVYLPYLGLLLAISVLLKPILETKRKDSIFTGLVLFSAVMAIITFQRNKVWTSTIDLVDDIIAKNPEVPYMARAYGMKANYLHYKKGQSVEAEKYYTKAIAVKPSDWESLYNRAMLYKQTKRAQNAIEDLTKCLELINRDHYFIYNEIGALEFSINRQLKAQHSFEKSIELNAEYADAWNNLGTVLATSSNWQKALNAFSKAIEIKPDYVDALKHRGLVYQQLGQSDQACTDFLAVKRLGSNVVNKQIQDLGCN
ncbi:MAG: tetratricopeptide repeat protein [Bacteroidetes bacterium]|nr:tetratricopeptide repeat protein [Bacteroidota bacterium]